MQKTARAAGVEGTGAILRADQHGARILNTSRSRMRKEAIARNEDQFYWPPARSSEELPLKQ
jgi:homoserine kinase